MPDRTRTSCLKALVVAALLLCGCSTSDGGRSSAPTSTTGTTVPPSSTGPVATTIPYDPSLNARSDLTVERACTYSDGVWGIGGKVQNSSSVERSYQIVVDYIAQSGDTVEDTQIVTVSSVAPGATASWTSSGGRGDPDLACVIRQVQYLPTASTGGTVPFSPLPFRATWR